VLSELTERGLRAPLLGISDGAPGLIGAFEADGEEAYRSFWLGDRSAEDKGLDAENGVEEEDQRPRSCGRLPPGWPRQ